MNANTQKQLIDQAGKVAVLFGGTSAEREISLLGGNLVLKALQNLGVDAVGIDAKENLVGQIIERQPQRVFNMLHGRGGEDGEVQGLLQLLAIPFTGSGVLGSALSIDKLKSKLIWKQLNLNTADFMILTAQSDWQSITDKLGTVVVKPVNEGSSIGMSIAATATELEASFQIASKFDSSVIAEQYIDGNEFSVTVLQQKALPAIQLKTNREFYDFDAKYIVADTEYICPVNLADVKLKALNELSIAAFDALGCEGWGRVDVMQSKEGEFFLLEVNTVPGMTDHSLVPLAARRAGIEFEDLLLQVLFAKELEVSIHDK